MARAQNPVLPGFHPDPSILRVGEEYFIANSTFEWFPGVELHRSKDLVNWERLPSPLSGARLLDMEGCLPSCGIWAPCLSHSDGLFWLIFTNVRSWASGPWKDTPNYLTTAPSIEGPWSDPVFLNCSGFDPSLFHDDDGRKWFVNMEWDYRKTGSKQFSGILLQEYKPSEKRLVGPIKKIYPGTAIGMVEGPHLYKRDGFYYVTAAEGGTGYEHAFTVARSRKIDGPYEFHPHNPLITSYGHPEIKLQKAGHASWCDTPDGRSYLAFLCGRPLPGTDRCVLGRETSIVELEWKDGWPYLKPPAGADLFREGMVRNWPDDGFDPPVRATPPQDSSRSVSYAFSPKAGIPLDFKTLRRAPAAGTYDLAARPGFLRLRGGQSPVSHYGQTLIARRQTDFCFAAETILEFEPGNHQHLAGLAYRYDEENQYLLTVSRDETAGRVLFVMGMVNGVFDRSNEIVLPETGPVRLGLTVRYARAEFRYSLDGKTWNRVRPVLDADVLSDEYGGLGFTGAFVGMFCCDTEAYAKTADFGGFSYTVL